MTNTDMTDNAGGSFAAARPITMGESGAIKAFKGFNRDMTCRGFQYKEGEAYELPEGETAEVCERGFHACENPLDCFSYYPPGESVYHEVEMGGEIDRQHDGDTKVAATKIKIGARLSIAGLVKAAIDFVMSKVKSTTGDGAHSATTGYWAHSATTGYWANSATTGDWAHSEVKGSESIAAVLGKGCKARGAFGCWLVLTERDDDGHILGVQAVKVDGESIKPDTWYMLRGGKVVEVKESKDANA